MADSSHIQWTDATWNVVTGCTKVSEGCRHCYIERTPPFRTQGRRFVGPRGVGEPGATTGVLVHPERLAWPLRWRRGRRVFVNSLSDLYHPAVTDDLIAEVFAVMHEARQHTFQVLTKRPARQAALLASQEFYGKVVARVMAWRQQPDGLLLRWPLPNVWLGTSVEDQRAARLRIPKLLVTPASVRFLSCEPLLGPIDLGTAACDGVAAYGHGLTRTTVHLADCCARSVGRLDWLIVGGESGSSARPMDLDWARDLIAQCETAGVAAFVKQLGSVWARQHGTDAKGGDWGHWPEDLRVRHYPAGGAQP
jgi:protein gp37